MPVELQGQIERITYQNETDGFTVAQLKVKGRPQPVTIVGHLVQPKPGEQVRLVGEWQQHPKYGEQFRFSSCQTLVPATAAGMEKYLASGFIKGIGPVMARRIVSRFGDETFEIIERAPERLAEVAGIGPKRLEVICQAWQEQKQIRELMLFLQNHEISTTYAPRIFKHYGSRAIEVIKNNPYQLASDIYGIGFLTADRMAARLGIAPEAPERLEAGIIYTLQQLSNDGHVCYPREELLTRAQELLEVPVALLEAALQRLAWRQELLLTPNLDPAATSGSEPEMVYLAGFYLAESRAAERLRSLLAGQRRLPLVDPDRALAWVQEVLQLQLAAQQAQAIRLSLQHPVLLITGGPGTGKTTIVKAILRIWSKLGLGVLLAAPTGRAAKRLAEVTGHEAKTIHRLLGYSPQKGGFQVNERRALDCDLLIVDEASMIDILLFYHLLKGVSPGTALILVGDAHQLPSVGPGQVFHDLIASGVVPVVELTEIFRQARESLIIVNAHRINQGLLPRWQAEPGHLADFYFLEEDDPEEVQRLILELVTVRIPRRFGFDPLEDIQVLTPMHRGPVGVVQLNQHLQQVLNPGQPGVERHGQRFQVGDKVMQLRNNYDKEVFNGDIGRITRIDPEMQELEVNFDGRLVLYDFSDLDELTLAYAISVHKSQGSEYPAVVLPLVTQHFLLLQRNLIYTAVTRGKKLVVLVGSKKALAIGVKNDKPRHRHTQLRYLLRQRAGSVVGGGILGS